MQNRKAFYTIWLPAIAVCLLFVHTGCWKEEYSYEYRPQDTVTRPVTTPLPDTTDTTTVDTITLLKNCPLCEYATSLAIGEWQLRYDTLFLCGKISSATLNTDKDAITFTGHSACTSEAGLTITASFNPVTFDVDRAGLTTTTVTCRYYDNRQPADLFTTGANNHITVTINQFEAQTGIAIGQFSGTVVTAQGTVVPITTGMFKVQLQ